MGHIESLILISLSPPLFLSQIKSKHDLQRTRRKNLKLKPFVKGILAKLVRYMATLTYEQRAIGTKLFRKSNHGLKEAKNVKISINSTF